MMKTGTFRYYIAMIITGRFNYQRTWYITKGTPLNRDFHFQLLCCTYWLRSKWEISPQIHRLAVFTHMESIIFGQVLVGGGDAIPLGRPYPYSLHHGVSYRPLIGTFCRQVCTLCAAHHFHLFKDLCFVYVYVYKYTCIILVISIIYIYCICMTAIT